MKREVHEEPYKTVIFWLSKEECEDENLLASLQPQFKEWKSKKYQPVVFESGTQSLEDGMYLIMKHNYKVFATRDN